MTHQLLHLLALWQYAKMVGCLYRARIIENWTKVREGSLRSLRLDATSFVSQAINPADTYLQLWMNETLT